MYSFNQIICCSVSQRECQLLSSYVNVTLYRYHSKWRDLVSAWCYFYISFDRLHIEQIIIDILIMKYLYLKGKKIIINGMNVNNELEVFVFMKYFILNIKTSLICYQNQNNYKKIVCRRRAIWTLIRIHLNLKRTKVYRLLI